MRRRVIWEKSLVRESPPRDGTRTEDYDRRESHPDLQALQGLRGLPAEDERRGDAGLTFAGTPCSFSLAGKGTKSARKGQGPLRIPNLLFICPLLYLV